MTTPSTLSQTPTPARDLPCTTGNPVPTARWGGPPRARPLTRRLAQAAGLLWLTSSAAGAWVGERDAGRLPPTTPPAVRTESTPAPIGKGAPGGPPRLEVKDEPSPGGYVLRVKVGGGRPEAVQVIPRGQALDLSLSTEGSRETRSGTAKDATKRSGYHGSVHRRVPLPADADLGRVTREVSGDTLLLRVPRRTAGPGARPAAPARPAGAR